MIAPVNNLPIIVISPGISPGAATTVDFVGIVTRPILTLLFSSR